MYTTKEKIDFIQSVFGACIVARDGINVAVQCPSCGNENHFKKKFSIRIDTDVCHCWICGLKAKSLSPILRKYFSKIYLEEYHKKFRDKKSYADLVETDELEPVILPPGFTLLSVSENSRDPDVRSAINYVCGRGLGKRHMWYYKLGTCTTGRFRRRVIMPSFDFEGNLNYYVARSVDKLEKRKYINSKVPKIEIIFNEINIDWKKELTIVEGPFDLMKCNDNATCLLGSDLSDKSLLFRKIIINQTPVVLALDSDMIKKTQKIAEMLSEYGIHVKILDCAGYEDVGAMSLEIFNERLLVAQNWSSEDKLFHLIDSIGSGSVLKK